MKVLIWSLFALIFLVSACTLKPASKKKVEEKVVYFEVDETIENDQIKIYIDGKLFYNKKVAFAEDQSFKDILTIPRPRGTYLLKVEVNGELTQQKVLPFKEEKKETKDHIYRKENYGFRISYDREKKQVKLEMLITKSLERKNFELDI